MNGNLPMAAKRTRLPRHRLRVTLMVSGDLPQATTAWWNGKTAWCVVRPDVDDKSLGMLLRTLAIAAGATELDYS